MGAWGTAAWDNDDAADWFGEFFEGIDVDSRIEDALSDPEDVDRVRAAGYLLAVLGRSYVWPGDLDKLDGFLERAIALLTGYLAAGSEFRDLWEDDPEVIDAVRGEISELEARLDGDNEADSEDDEEEDEEVEEDDED